MTVSRPSYKVVVSNLIFDHLYRPFQLDEMATYFLQGVSKTSAKFTYVTIVANDDGNCNFSSYINYGSQLYKPGILK